MRPVSFAGRTLYFLFFERSLMNAHQALVEIPSELGLLIACSRTTLDDVSAEKLGALIGAKPDWQRVLCQARYHGVTPLTQRHLSRFDEGVPAFVLEELGNYTRKNAVHNLMLSNALLGILGELTRTDIEAVPYKGPVLACTAYGDVSLRSFKDLDVIVRPRDFERAVAGLAALGYAPTDDDPKGHFHQSFVQQETGVMLELHHDVLRRNVFPTPLTVTKLWPQLTEVSFLGHQVNSFSPEDTLLLLCLHGSSHAWQGLTWICDVAEFVRTHPTLDWATFLQTAARARLLRMTLLGLKLARDVLAALLPVSLVQVLDADPKLQALSRTITTRMCKQNARDEVALTYQLQSQLRSGIWRLPLYGRLLTKRLRLQGFSW